VRDRGRTPLYVPFRLSFLSLCDVPAVYREACTGNEGHRCVPNSACRSSDDSHSLTSGEKLIRHGIRGAESSDTWHDSFRGYKRSTSPIPRKNPLRRASADSVRSSKMLIVRANRSTGARSSFPESEVESRVRTFSSVMHGASFPKRKAPAKIVSKPTRSSSSTSSSWSLLTFPTFVYA
jgi:hypothetical protein